MDIEKFHEVKKRKNKKFITFLIIVLLSVVSSSILLTIGYFDIKHVNVEGLETLDKLEVIKWSQIVIGKNIFKLNKEEITSNLNNHPYIKSSKLGVKLPTTLNIYIEERTILGAVIYLGSYIYFDDEGYILKIDQAFNSIEYPVISDLTIDPPKVGNQIRVTDKEKLEGLLNFMSYLEEGDLLNTIREIKIIDNGVIVLKCNRGNYIYFKGDNDIGYRISFLKEILDYLEEKGVGSGYINMLHNGNPVYSPTKEWED